MIPLQPKKLRTITHWKIFKNPGMGAQGATTSDQVKAKNAANPNPAPQPRAQPEAEQEADAHGLLGPTPTR